MTNYAYSFSLDAKRLVAAALIAGFKDSPTKITYKDVAGVTYSDIPEATLTAAIAIAESSGNMWAYHANSNGSVDLGAWQINSPAHADLLASPALSSPWRIADNASMAYSVYKAAGDFSPWSVTTPNKTTGVAPVSGWYYEEIGLTGLRYASDGMDLVRAALKSGKTLAQILAIELRDFTPYYPKK